MRAALLACLTIALVGPVGDAEAARRVRKAPAGLAFYTPPKHLGKGRHGDLIWSRPLGGPDVLPSAGRSYLVLYRSVSVAGKPIAVSGSVSVPRGKAPKHGWPVVSYAHGTTGSADVCAPTRDTLSNPGLHALVAYVNPLLDSFLRHGYAVLRTDYEGLGTPGPHPYLIGRSEGRGVIDIVRAARQLNRGIGRSWAIAGHSQGGTPRSGPPPMRPPGHRSYACAASLRSRLPRTSTSWRTPSRHSPHPTG